MNNKSKRTWTCERCGDKLPTRGMVWSTRYAKWRKSKRNTSGMYCDLCMDGINDGC